MWQEMDGALAVWCLAGRGGRGAAWGQGRDVAASPTSASPLPKTMISSWESLNVVEQVH